MMIGDKVRIDLLEGTVKRIMHDHKGTHCEVEHMHKGKYVVTWFREEQCVSVNSTTESEDDEQ